ncbi:hypothetical protein AB0D27_22525 [Streptomyces sp. NPDC048415]|uniref:hypothetical protein n=1 Tax=Streptomyces sp. NPDC048415 TaxID=3154822 RepID=UPI00341D8AC2
MTATRSSSTDLEDAVLFLERALEESTEDLGLDSMYHGLMMARSLLRERNTKDAHLSDRLIPIAGKAHTLTDLQGPLNTHEVPTSALLDRHHTTGDGDWLAEATRLQDQAARLFGENAFRGLAENA